MADCMDVFVECVENWGNPSSETISEIWLRLATSDCLLAFGVPV